MTTFSIITPSLARETLVRTCHSIDTQQNADWQHIVMIDRPECMLSAAQKARLKEISSPRRQIHLCPQIHRDFGNTCRSNAWDLARGDYLLYLDDDDYYVNDTLGELEKALAARPSPVWGIFPSHSLRSAFFPSSSRPQQNLQQSVLPSPEDWRTRASFPTRRILRRRRVRRATSDQLQLCMCRSRKTAGCGRAEQSWSPRLRSRLVRGCLRRLHRKLYDRNRSHFTRGFLLFVDTSKRLGSDPHSRFRLRMVVLRFPSLQKICQRQCGRLFRRRK